MKNNNVGINDKLFYCNNSILLKSSSKNPISDFSYNLLCNLIQDKVLQNASGKKILISYQGNPKFYSIVEKINYFFKNHKHIIYNYDSKISTDPTLDELAFKKAKLDYFIKIISHQNDTNLTFKIYNQTLNYIYGENLEKVANLFNENIKNQSENFEIKKVHDLNLVDANNLIQEQASKSEILRAFINVKPRYKSKNLIITQDTYSQELLNNLLTNYDSKFICRPFDLKTRWILMINKLFNKSYTIKNLYQSLIKVNDYSNLKINLLIDRKLVSLNTNQVVLIYLDFFLEELKRSKTVNLKDLFVLVSPNASYQVLELLKQYNVKYYFANSKALSSVINHEKCIFAYSYDKINANPRYSHIFNSYYFIVCLIWMLNSYVNRNNLLSFKNDKLIENFGKVIFKTKEVSFNYENISSLVKHFINTYKKSKTYDLINVFKFWSDNKYALLKLINSTRKHTTILTYDFINDKLIIEHQLCSEYNQNDIPYFLDYSRMKKYINKSIKQINKQNKVNKKKPVKVLNTPLTEVLTQSETVDMKEGTNND
ncbi:MAG5620 family putative phospho-sugar mutase [Mycoplasmopsis felifaucium]|uniref:MAG5620 family putative phospho-sugar mutase n=1 Tax=Mycoplasmopsis felifaucium TaxID=35768 RepID=UPI000690DDAD|nr:hypothetical protein [Mycoplasmopsis felifaucium]